MSLAEMFYQESGGRSPVEVLREENNKLRAEIDRVRGLLLTFLVDSERDSEEESAAFEQLLAFAKGGGGEVR